MPHFLTQIERARSASRSRHTSVALAVVATLTACSTVSDTMDMLSAGMRTVQEPSSSTPTAVSA
ncbi:hypothetical protein [Roseateles sp. LKC17W]|uniref:Uncharacterized protein n=1 Tax=Pelomonas margarita TaxID=3299031 RepID=A0ABW7FQK2_9BURK